MYLKNILINNYKSIQKAQIDFEPGLNIVIGKNGAGKSNLLEYIESNLSLSNVLQGINNKIFDSSLQNLDYEYLLEYHENKSTNKIEIKHKNRNNASKEFSFKLLVTSQKKTSGEKIIFSIESKYEGNILVISNNDLTKATKYIKILSSFQITKTHFSLPSTLNWLDLPATITKTLDGNIDLSDKKDILLCFWGFQNYIIFELGRLNNRPISIDYLELIKENIATAFNEYISNLQLNYHLKKLTPISEIRLSPNINIYKTDNKILVQNLILEFKVNGDWLPWNYLSDGTKRLFYIITECLSITSGLVLIEEPELGIYPDELFSLMEFFREQAQYKQIIISTHSPMVLDVLEPDELDSINIAKMTRQGTQFYKLTEAQKTKAKNYIAEVGALSQYWVHSDLVENE